MRFKNDRFTVTGDLLYFERTHNTLDACIIGWMDSAHLGQIITVLFRYVSPQLLFLLSDIIEDIGHRIG